MGPSPITQRHRIRHRCANRISLQGTDCPTPSQLNVGEAAPGTQPCLGCQPYATGCNIVLMEFREMGAEKIARIGEINREESIEGEFVPEPDASGFGIVARYRAYQQPMIARAWGEAGSEGRIRKWRPELEAGGTMFGAFKADRFAGFLILGPSKTDQSAEVVALFVDRDFRRQGVGAKLLQLAENKSILLGIEALFVYSNPTASAVYFYLKHGFQITGLISKHIAQSLSGEILMAKKLPPAT